MTSIKTLGRGKSKFRYRPKSKHKVTRHLDHAYIVAWLAFREGHISLKACDRIQWGLELAMRELGTYIPERVRPGTNVKRDTASSRYDQG